MCGTRLRMGLLGLVLALLLPLPLYSQSSEASEGVLDSETLLDEYERRLDRAIDERETLIRVVERQRGLIESASDLISRQASLIETQATQLTERDNRLNRIESSFDEYESNAESEVSRARWIGRGEGVVAGVIIGAGLILILR